MRDSDVATILVVDDQQADLLKGFLDTNGYQVLTADNGFTALSVLNEHAIDLILLDVAMPGMDGYEVMRRIRNSPDGENVSILLLSTHYNDHEDAARSLEVGADDYMLKPTNPSELRARVALKLRQRRLEQALQRAREEAESQNELLRRAFRIVQSAAGHLDPGSLALTIYRGLMMELLVDRAAVWRFHETTREFQPVPSDAAALPSGISTTIADGTPLLYNARRVLVPMQFAGAPAGLLDLERSEGWSEGAITILQALGDSLGILFQNTRYVQQIARENQFHELLNKLAAEEVSLAEMLMELRRFLNTNLLLLDRWFNLIVSEPTPAMVEQGQLREEVIDLYRSKHITEQLAKKRQVMSIEAHGSIPFHRVAPVVLSGDVIAILIAVPPEGGANQGATEGELERSAHFLAGVLQRHRESALHQQHLRADFLSELLSGRLKEELSQTTIFLRANALGLNLAQPAFVAQLELPRFSQQVDWTQRLFEQRVTELLDPLVQDARRVRSLLNLEGLEVMMGERVVAVISLPGRTTEEQARTWAARWAQQLLSLYRQRAKENELAIGLGRLATEWQDLRRSANEAERALRWVLSNARTNVAYYGDLGSERLLAAVNDREELERFCQEQLGPVLEYDEVRDGELVRTLEVFFANGGHMARAAEVLAIHPNTLKYRLEQVYHLTGRDPRDSAISLDLQLALKIHSML